MNTITAIIATLILATSISVAAPTAGNDQSNLIGPPTTNAGDVVEPGGPPTTFDGGNDTPVCLSCN
jgi:hypothetical protein